MKKYEVEFKSTTYRIYTVDAETEDAAVEAAFTILDEDEEVSSCWKKNADKSTVEQLLTY